MTHDREILRLAVPAFGALAAEPLYVLADTAIVGHLGTRPLGGLGVAGTVLTAVFGVFNFLAYGTTAHVARRFGAGDPAAAAEHGVAGCGSRSASASRSRSSGSRCAGPIVHAMGASAAWRRTRCTYLRISLLGAPFVLLALAGTGYLRGLAGHAHAARHRARGQHVQPRPRDRARLRHPPRHRGLGVGNGHRPDSALRVAYLAIVHHNVRAPSASRSPERERATRRRGRRRAPHRPHRARCCSRSRPRPRSRRASATCRSPRIRSRGSSGTSLPCASTRSRSPARRSSGSRSARAIATGARASSRRMLAVGSHGRRRPRRCSSLASDPLLAIAFTQRPRGAPRTASVVIVAVALMQPLAAIVFVLDGILIGAGDARYLAWAMVARHRRVPSVCGARARDRIGTPRALGRAVRLHDGPSGRHVAPVPQRIHGWSRARLAT